MPIFENRPMSDPSTLTEGWHPAYVVGITTEAIPDGWEMKKKDTLMYRWRVAIWEATDDIGRLEPENQDLLSSRAFTPKGKFQASKAYLWTTALIGHEPRPGEAIDLDPMFPLPCVIQVERPPGTEYARLKQIRAWPRGDARWPLPQTPPAAAHALAAAYRPATPETARRATPVASPAWTGAVPLESPLDAVGVALGLDNDDIPF